MDTKLSWRFKFSENSRFRLVLFIAFIVGIVLLASSSELIPSSQQHPKISKFLLDIMPRIGEAIIIAVFIAIFVDDPTKRKLLKEFAADISSHMVGRFLPPTLREHIHQYLGVDFVRYNWEIKYAIDVLEEHPGYIRLATTSTYEMENRSPFGREYVVAYEVENSWFPKIGETQITFVKARDLKEEQDVFERGPSAICTKIEDGFVKLCPDKDMKIKFPGHEHQTHHRYKFEVRSVEYFRDSFQGPFIAFHPVLKTTLTVIYPDDKLAVDLSLTFDDVKAATQSDAISNGKKWTIIKPILPGQGFAIRWDPVPQVQEPA